MIGNLLLLAHQTLGHEKTAAFLGVEEPSNPREWCWLCRGEEPPPEAGVRRRGARDSSAT